MEKRLHHPIKLPVAETLTKALHVLGDASTVEENYLLLGATPNAEMGHMAFPLFSQAKKLKKSPVELAKILDIELKNHSLPAFIEKTLVAGPYLNLFFKTSTLASNVLPIIESQSYFKLKLLTDLPKTMVEYSQPNTHKELHVGHMRNLCLGDAVIKLHRYESAYRTSDRYSDIK